MSTDRTHPDSAEQRHAGPIVAVLALAGIVVALMQTLIVPIVPRLPELIDASATDTAWAITVTLLASAVAVPVMGRLGDMFGKRRLLLVSLALLVAGSAIAALSTSLAPLIVGRALQGMSAGVIPLGISVMRDVLPPKSLAGSVAMMSASIGIGSALGLPAAALIAEYTDWHVLFWVSAALGVAVIGSVVAVVPESEVGRRGTFDFVGAASMSIALIALLLAISKGGDWGWTSGLTTLMAVASLVAGAIWLWRELRAPQPLVNVRLSVGRQVLFTNLASVVFGFALFVMALVFPQVVQLPADTGYGLGRSMLVAGLAVAPCGVVMLLITPVSSRITVNHGPKSTLMLGALTVAVGYGIGTMFLHSVWQIVIVSVIIGAGTGLAYGAIPTLIMGAVPVGETGSANSFNALMRSLGTSFASAVSGVMLAHMTIPLGENLVPSESAIRILMAGGSGAALAALALAAFLPGSRVPESPAALITDLVDGDSVRVA